MSARDLSAVLLTMIGVVLICYATIFVVSCMLMLQPPRTSELFWSQLLWFPVSSSACGAVLIVFRRPLSAGLPDVPEVPSAVDAQGLLGAMLVGLGVLFAGYAIVPLVVGVARSSPEGPRTSEHLTEALSLGFGILLLLGARPLARALWPRREATAHHASSPPQP